MEDLAIDYNARLPMFFFVCSLQAIALDPRLDGDWVISDVKTNSTIVKSGEHKGWVFSFHHGTCVFSTNTGEKVSEVQYLTSPSKKYHGILVAVDTSSGKSVKDGMLYRVEKEKLVLAAFSSPWQKEPEIPTHFEIKTEDKGKDKFVYYLERKKR
jgi:hypothetical protein